MTTTAQHLRTIATTWTDLRDALGAPTQHSWPPVELAGYLRSIEQYDPTDAAALRALERDPAQIGQRPIPIRLRVHETMRTVEAALVETADQIAPTITIAPMKPPAPRRAAPARTRDERVAWADHARRIELARADATDLRRWRYTGQRTAPYAALWLLARVERRSGPFRPLTEQHRRHIARVAAEAVARIESTLDLADRTAELTAEHPCPCGGTIEVYGGAGAQPVARCQGCGALWTEAGVIAA